ncbi:cobalamin biosynthesis protein CbiX [Glutamicibacter sp. MNS18]|uniref:sirohydrochlorin chelatase n=1 Tax=Glutamicibacter sp. MNS18 TaxID=2989817 RepID=UPI002236A791|nr:CbiX/SirB N-terminal domain-containing protein [Glutamicibacter sp. MNS18]MCW4465758.1 cobalamin biosynthesis protein CbiX [Glutamicibacter sp. MNS18]
MSVHSLERDRAAENRIDAPALLAISHGTDHPVGQRLVGALVAAVQPLLPDVTVQPGFVDVQQPQAGELVLRHASDTQAPCLVPLLLSRGVHVNDDLAAAAARNSGVKVARALGPDPVLALVLERRLVQAGWQRGEPVILGCAGTRDPGGLEDCHQMARLLEQRLETMVRCAFVSASVPELSRVVTEARQAHRGRRIVVSSYLLAPGFFWSLAGKTQPDILTDPILSENYPIPHELAQLVVHRYRQATIG